MLANAAPKTKRTLGQGVLSLAREALLKRVDFDSQEQLAVSIQEHTDRTQNREEKATKITEKRSKDRSETRHQRIITHCNQRL
jgi:hypothetical protein